MCIFGFCNLWASVYLDFEMCGFCVCVGLCNEWDCVCVGFLMRGCVYVWLCVCGGFLMVGCDYPCICYLWVCVSVVL